MELRRGANGQHAEQDQGDELSHLEWRLRLRRCNLFERGRPEEKLHDQNKDINAGGHGCRQEDHRPAIEAFRSDQAVQNNKSRTNSYQAQYDVKHCECTQYHGDLLFRRLNR